MLAGVEGGGTKVVCTVGTGPDDLREVRVPTTTPDQTLARVAAAVRDLAGGRAPAALGVGWFGPLHLDPADERFGRLAATPKTGWTDVDVLGGLRSRLGVPAAVTLDVAAAALGEHRWGALRGVRSGVYVTVGTGIGASPLVDGVTPPALVHPEMGHLTVVRHPGDRTPSVCPFHPDCLEGLASGPAVARREGAPAEHLTGPAAERAARVVAFYLAQLAAALAVLTSPQRVVVGGGVTALPGLLEAVRAETVRRLGGYLDAPSGDLSGWLVPPGTGSRAGVLGALVLAGRAAAHGT